MHVSNKTNATFHLPHSSKELLEVNVKTPSLAMAVVPRDAVSALTEKWTGAIGIYVLLGPCDDGEHEYRAYVGKSETGGLKERLTTHRHSHTWEKSHGLPKEWWKRAFVVRSRDEEGFNSAEAGWLEGRLWDVLDRAKAAQLIGKKGDDQTLPKHARDELAQFIPPITAVLRAIGASPDTPDQQVTLPASVKKYDATVADLIQAKLLAPEDRLRSIPSTHESIAVVKSDGSLEVNNLSYASPSAAAVAVVGHATNGWAFWGFASGDGKLVPIKELRARLKPKPVDDQASAVQATAPTTESDGENSRSKTGGLRPLLQAGLLQSGDVLYATFKRVEYEAKVERSGNLRLVDGSTYSSPSSAAVQITGKPTNGWVFWKMDHEGATVTLAQLRAQTEPDESMTS